jgi:small subunit ribosomal protein S20
MANTRSSEKDIRKSRARNLRNTALKSRLRTVRKRALAAITTGDEAAAKTAYDSFASVADKAAKVKVIHKNTASRLKSRLASKFKKPAA